MGRRKKIKIRAGQDASLEWIGFRDAGIDGNLDVSTEFELVPPSAASSVLLPDVTVLRILGDVSIRNQSTVTAMSTFGMMVQKVNVGGDQTIDDGINPNSTDVDDFDHSGIMWWRTFSAPNYGHGTTAEYDSIPIHIPFDIKTKRRLNKRDSIILRIQAGTTGRLQASVNCRVLVKLSR